MHMITSQLLPSTQHNARGLLASLDASRGTAQSKCQHEASSLPRRESRKRQVQVHVLISMPVRLIKQSRTHINCTSPDSSCDSTTKPLQHLYHIYTQGGCNGVEPLHQCYKQHLLAVSGHDRSLCLPCCLYPHARM